MDCATLRRLALEGGDLTSPEAKRHLDDCPACGSLFADGTGLARLLHAAGPDHPAAAPSLVEIEGLLAREQGPWARLHALPSRLRLALGGAALALPVLIGVAMHRHNLAAYPPARLMLELGALAALSLASCWVWLRPLHKRQPGHGLLVALLGLGLALPWVLSALPAAVPTLASSAGTALGRAARCFVFGSLTATPALVLLAGLGRRTTGWPGFAVLPAAAAALAGLLGLALHCPDASPAHLLAGHAPIAFALPLVLLLLRGLRSRST